MDYFINVKNGEIVSCSNLPIEDGKNIEVTKTIYDDFNANRDKYYFGNGLKTRSTQEMEELKHKQLQMFSMTKYDFKKALVSIGVDFKAVKTLIATDEDMQDAWDLCSAVYRGDEFLNNDAILKSLNVTSNQLDTLFEKYGELR